MRIRKRSGDAFITYKGILLSKDLIREIATTRYFGRYDTCSIVHVNQCPECLYTNVNMDQWILHCAGSPSYIYHHPNGEAYRQGAGVDKQALEYAQHSYGSTLKILRESKNHPNFHEPVEMVQEIVTKKDAQLLYKKYK